MQQKLIQEHKKTAVKNASKQTLINNIQKVKKIRKRYDNTHNTIKANNKTIKLESKNNKQQ